MDRFEIQLDIASTILGVLILITGLGLVAFSYEEITAVVFGLFFIVMGQGFLTNAKLRSLRRAIKELEGKVE